MLFKNNYDEIINNEKLLLFQLTIYFMLYLLLNIDRKCLSYYYDPVVKISAYVDLFVNHSLTNEENMVISTSIT